MGFISLFSQNLAKEKYVFFDFETTGFYPLLGDRVIEIAMIKVENGNTVDTFETLVNPRRLIPEDASKMNHITDEMVADSPFFDKLLSMSMIEFIEDAVMVAHNAAFDLGFFSSELARNKVAFEGWRSIDTLKLARSLFPNQRNALKNLMKRYNIFPEGDLHRAIVDTEVLKGVFFNLIDEQNIRELPLDQLIKRYGFQGNLMHRYIPAQIRESLVEGKQISGKYEKRDGTVTDLTLTPYAPVWNDNKWFLMGEEKKSKNIITVNCKKFVDLE